MTSLVIVESPAKCKKIRGFLGEGFEVLATMGHIRALEEDLDAVGLDRDFEPKFRFLSEKSKATKPILEAAKRADTIYLAADDDREGEAIAYSVACLLKRDPTTMPRAVFHEITAKAVRNAIQNPRRIDMNRVFAQQARAVLDMMVGFTISPLLWKHVARALSAGRCQTPALRLVYDREQEIKAHTTETSWALTGEFQHASFLFPAKMLDELDDQESAMNYLENVHEDATVSVKEVDQRPWTSNPPKPLITSTLQQEASALHKLNPKSTMKIAQTLYEAGHITYMRTDHAILSEEAITEAQEQVKKQYGQEYVGDAAAARATPEKAPSKSKKKAQDVSGAQPAGTPASQEAHELGASRSSKQAAPPASQEAHEAIRPTHFDRVELPANEDWSAQDRKVYTLIYRRALQAVMAQAKGQTRTATLHLQADQDAFPWQASWKSTDFQGWQILGKQANLDKNDDDPDVEDGDNDKAVWKKAQAIKPGLTLTWKHLQAAPKRSRAAPRFTEATLIRELEKRGIGRPSTFASLVEVLFDKLYVEKKDIEGQKITNTILKLAPQVWPPLTQTTQTNQGAEKQKLVSTALGESVLTFCLKEFPQLFAYDFTAAMESRLDKVAKGEEAWKQLCRDTWGSYKDHYTQLMSKDSKPSSSEKVKDFGGGFKAVMSQKGPLLVQEGPDPKKDKAQFFPFPEGYTLQSLTEEIARAHVKQFREDTTLGTWNGKPILKKKGPFGVYLQCGDLRVPFQENDTLEQLYTKFRVKQTSEDTKFKKGPYSFGTGQYGPYMYKTDLKTKIFVSLPEGSDPRTMTAEELDDVYKKGVEAKKARGSFRGGRGGRGGRGRGRG